MSWPSCLRSALVGAGGGEDAVGPKPLQEETMAGFTQIIEMQTSRIDEVER